MNLHELVRAMQGQCRQYLEPSGYTSFDRKRIAFAHDREAKDSLFISDMIYLLDGPEQRAAQGIEAGTGETREAGLDAKHESPVAASDAPQ